METEDTAATPTSGEADARTYADTVIGLDLTQTGSTGDTTYTDTIAGLQPRQAEGAAENVAADPYTDSITGLARGAPAEEEATEEAEQEEAPRATMRRGSTAALDEQLGDVEAREEWLDTTENAWRSSPAYEETPSASQEPAGPNWQESGLYVPAQVQAARDVMAQELLDREMAQGLELAEVKAYGSLFGDETMQDPEYQSAGLSPEQQAALAERMSTGQAQLEEQDEVRAHGQITGDETMQDPKYQSAGLSPEQRAALYEQVAGSQEREQAQAQEQDDVRSYGALTDDPTMLEPDYQSAGLSPRQVDELQGAREQQEQEERAEAARLQGLREELNPRG